MAGGVQFVRGRDFKIWEVARASSAAPTFFPGEQHCCSFNTELMPVSPVWLSDERKPKHRYTFELASALSRFPYKELYQSDRQIWPCDLTDLSYAVFGRALSALFLPVHILQRH